MENLVLLDYNRIQDVLREIKEDSMKPLFASELADERIAARPTSRLWARFYTTASIVATGRTKGKTPVAVFVHTPNYLLEPKHVAGNHKFDTMPIPKKEFLRYVGMEDGKTVFVVDYKFLEEAPELAETLDEVLKHPAMAPILGGEVKAQEYMGIWKKGHDKDIEERYKIVPRQGSFLGSSGFWEGLHKAVRQIGLPRANPLLDEPSGNFIFLNGIGSSPCSYGGFDYFSGSCFLARSTSPPRLPKLENLILRPGF